LNNSTTLVKLRNSLGVDDYNGPMNEDDDKWDLYNKSALDINFKDGVFFMPLKEFKNVFGTI